MAGSKRKADKQANEPLRSKRHESSGDTSTAKRRRRDSSGHDKKQNTAESSGRTLSTKSLLDEEERAFPRGGASVLTPLETKQIQVQATKDVLFEESGRKKRAESVDSDDEIDQEDRSAKKASKKPKKNKPKKPESAAEDFEPRIKVQGLKFKHLTAGALLLGRINHISDHDITLDLPNNLTGTVQIKAISSAVSRSVESDEDGEEDSANETQKGMDIDLRSMFHLGQYLRARVLSTLDDSIAKDAPSNKKKIELSIDPEQTNGNLSTTSLDINTMIQASIASIEDHGVVLDLGLPDKSVRGFMPSKELPEGYEMDQLQEGSVFLCLVTSKSSNGKVVKLSAREATSQSSRDIKIIRNSPTIDPLLPGTAVEVLVTQVSRSSFAGKIIGLVNATADTVHSGAGLHEDVASRFTAGSKVKARIIFKLGNVNEDAVGISVLDHVLCLSAHPLRIDDNLRQPLDVLPASSFVDQAKIIHVEPGLGLYLSIGIEGASAFVHCSRVTDGKQEDLSIDDGKFRPDTVHRARILGYNSLDGLFLASLQKSVLEQPFLRLEDVTVGQSVKAQVEKIVVNASGLGGVLLRLAEGITGLVPEIHMADIHLQHPERKFKEGVVVTARVLSVDLDKRQLRLTLKKTLVNTDAHLWTRYDQIQAGSWSPGTILKLTPQGAVMQFFGNIRGFLPTVEMSSDYIRNPSDHFRIGQTITVRAKNVLPEDARLTVSCRNDMDESIEDVEAYQKLKIGDIVGGTISAKSLEDVTVELEGSGLKATLRIGHLTDRTVEKNASALKALRIGQNMKDLLIIELFERKRSIILSKKPSLLQAAKLGAFPKQFSDMKEQEKVSGFVQNVTSEAVFVQFGAGLVGLLPKGHVSEDLAALPNFGLQKDQSLITRVLALDPTEERFLLSMKEPNANVSNETKTGAGGDAAAIGTAINPVDEVSTSSTDYVLGKITKARITSVKETQLNVQLADNVQGRVDVSEVFHDWQEIKDRKHPLRSFKAKQILSVRILGIHDAQSHSYLPITHRGRKFPVFELSAKAFPENSISSMDQLETDKWYIAFVNNVTKFCLWVNISPNVRGRVQRSDVSEDVSVLNDLASNFPEGSAIRVRAKHIDINKGHLDLSAKKASSEEELTLDRVSVGMITAGPVVKITERSLLVKLSETLTGLVPLTELADDFSEANPTTNNKGDIVRVCVVDVDRPNKKIILSTRPSKVLSSSSNVKDPSFIKSSQLKVNDIVRGFVKNVADIGLFINIGHNVTAFVRVAEISDEYVKDWKSGFEIDKLVSGKIIMVDENSGQVQMSLKRSVVAKDYVPLTTFNDFSVGQVITGKIRKVEEFGAFIVVDNSQNVSGLCHRSEVAERRVPDVRKLYKEGDVVKAIVLSIEPEKRRISFGLKRSYFENMSDSEDEEAIGSEVEDRMEIDESRLDGGVALDDATREASFDEEDFEHEKAPRSLIDNDEGLNPGGFDWTGALDRTFDDFVSSSEAEDEPDITKKTKKKRRKPAIQVDATGDLEKYGPRTVDDFERLLFSQRDDSSVWIRYMAFHLQLNEIDEARALADRALNNNEISLREQEERDNVRVARLHLENTYGTQTTLDEAFADACARSDPADMHARLTSIYIESGKLQQADVLFREMQRKKYFGADPKLWVNYATFLFDSLGEPQRARSLLDAAMQSAQALPDKQRRDTVTDLVAKFARLEFKRKKGDPERGRTMFAGLCEEARGKRKWDLWDMRVDLERSLGETDNARKLYEDMAKMRMKSSRGRVLFKRWRDFEEAQGNQKGVKHVLAKAEEFVKKKREERDAEGDSD